MNFRKTFLTGLTTLATLLPACNKMPDSGSVRLDKMKVTNRISVRPSYKLEDLCASELSWKDINIQVRVEDSKILWDYKKYRDEIFGYVADFFIENMIDCRVTYSDKELSRFQSSNEFGVEILDSEERMKERFAYLSTGINFDPNEIKLILEMRGYAATRSGVALINGGAEEFKELVKTGEMSIEQVEEQFPDIYKGMTKREYLFRGYAANICHEVLHCMGLFHPGTSNGLVEGEIEGVPNIMSFFEPRFTPEQALGYCLTPLQQGLIHNFIAGENNYMAFIDSSRDLDIYWYRIMQANNLSSK